MIIIKTVKMLTKALCSQGKQPVALKTLTHLCDYTTLPLLDASGALYLHTNPTLSQTSLISRCLEQTPQDRDLCHARYGNLHPPL